MGKRLQQLFESEHWSEDDKKWLLQYLEDTDNHELYKMMEEKFAGATASSPEHGDADRLLALIHEKISPSKPERRLITIINRRRLSIAASIILIISAAAFFYFDNLPGKNAGIALVKQRQTPVHDVAPGRDNAILTFSDGLSIVLDSVSNGMLAREGNTRVQKMDGKIMYAGNSEAGHEVLYNTLVTSRGNQYHLQLADGSKVWLNAASSIRFPATFTGNERMVEVTGEVYFEVAHDAEKPFKVKIKTSSGESSEVHVLGTHFNINAYDDEAAVKTTLTEGKVKVAKKGSIVLLQPAQQAVMAKGDPLLKVQQADVEKELAWKTGMFEFRDDDLPTIMRQLARWYNVDVNFEATVSRKLFNGSIRRQASLSQVLQILKLAGVSYTLDGRNVTIKSK